MKWYHYIACFFAGIAYISITLALGKRIRNLLEYTTHNGDK